MKNYTHITGALVFFLIFSFLIGLKLSLMGLFFAGWISVFPDILDKLIGKHKSYGHSIFLVVPCLFVSFINVTIAIALIIGLISHTILDLITTNGTPFLTPLSNTNFVILIRKRRIKTGTNQEKSVFITLLLFLTLLLCFNFGSYPFLGTSLISVFGFDCLNPEKMSHPNENSNLINSNFKINLKLDQKMNKSITLENINENVTSILVKDAEIPS